MTDWQGVDRALQDEKRWKKKEEWRERLEQKLQACWEERGVKGRDVVVVMVV